MNVLNDIFNPLGFLLPGKSLNHLLSVGNPSWEVLHTRFPVWTEENAHLPGGHTGGET